MIFINTEKEIIHSRRRENAITDILVILSACEIFDCSSIVVN